ncbi:MAG TPA: serine/threonine-protein kinase [Planctomycetota bacterium]|nr:serine/threonine-protein kinase [Planctomycetota bacterium]
MDSSVTPSGLLESVLARALELRDEGCADWVELACKDCPELAQSVREAASGTDLLPKYFIDPSTVDSGLGRTIDGRFRLSKRIGAGAMGVVYMAEDLELLRTVAVKILRHGLKDPEESMHRFSREAAAMASVQHPSVITIHDRGRTDEGEHFIVMEWIDGAPLNDIVEEASRKSDNARIEDTAWIQRSFGISSRGESSYLRTVVRWVADLATGLEVVHAAGVLHRDIKPSNVLVRKNGKAVLLDFGIALLDGDSTLTRGVTSVGTPSYMPPEALVRGQNRSPASDVYSLTATLYHLLALRPPYQGTPSEVLAAIATREPVPAVRHRPGLPRDLQAILEKGMHRKPRARYASAGALEADLRAFLDYRPVVARPVTALTRATRSLMRSKVARGAALALGVVLLSSAAFELNQVRQTKLRAKAFALERQFPPNFTTVGKTNRVYRYEADRAHVQALLDAAAETGVDSTRVYLLRASFRLDHGDPAGAARDMGVVAEEVDTPYASELAARYSALGPDARGADAVDLKDLPERESALDRYLDGYHCLRAGNEAAALERFSDPDVRKIAHAEEMRLAWTPFPVVDTDDAYRRAHEAYDDTLRLEAKLGGRTSTTAHTAGRMLDVMSRYDEALVTLQEGIALADRAHTIRINAGWAAYGLGLYDEARRHFEVAIDLRPNDPKPLKNLVGVLIEQGEFETALQRIASAPLDEGYQPPKWRLVQQSRVETHRALAEKQRGATATSKASVQLAVEHIRAARELGAIDKFVEAADLAILDGLVAGNDEAVFIGVARSLLADPHNWWQIQDLLKSMPVDLSADASKAVRRVLEALVQRLASRHVEPKSPAVSDH